VKQNVLQHSVLITGILCAQEQQQQQQRQQQRLPLDSVPSPLQSVVIHPSENIFISPLLTDTNNNNNK
jgi:hypothetical protein